mmetsp:Transcript_30168/g.79231  ORF Transcript_30168/g.79231 Transcript_30168/m.79231 type:complete len:225 (-) Transcript_30168:85-759(-)
MAHRKGQVPRGLFEWVKQRLQDSPKLTANDFNPHRITNINEIEFCRLNAQTLGVCLIRPRKTAVASVAQSTFLSRRCIDENDKWTSRLLDLSNNSALGTGNMTCSKNAHVARDDIAECLPHFGNTNTLITCSRSVNDAKREKVGLHCTLFQSRTQSLDVRSINVDCLCTTKCVWLSIKPPQFLDQSRLPCIVNSDKHDIHGVGNGLPKRFELRRHIHMLGNQLP